MLIDWHEPLPEPERLIPRTPAESMTSGGSQATKFTTGDPPTQQYRVQLTEPDDTTLQDDQMLRLRGNWINVFHHSQLVQQ